jgi:CubicO group peptidase (beta-lactamase class C family)
MSRRFRFPKNVDFREAARAFVLLALVPLAAFTINGAGVANAQTAELNWPSKQVVRPRDIALSYPCGGGSLCDISAFMDRQHVCALVVMRAGETVLHRTSVRSDDDPCKTSVERDRYGIVSITKSIVSLLFGFVYEDASYGPPVDLDSSAADLIRAAGLPRYDGGATLRQLLHMAGGMEWSEDEIDATLKVQVDQNGDLVGKNRRLKDSVAERLQHAKFFAPGQFHYSGFDSQLIGILTEHRLTPDKGFTHGTLDEALERFLWQNLPVEKNAEWNADFGGHPAAHCCAYTSAEDLAALGNWVLTQYNEGEDAEADWIRASVTDTVNADWTCKFGGTERTFRYGYQWWVPSDDKQDGFTGIGTEGQYLHIFPGQNVVIAQFGEKIADDADTCEAMLVHRLLADQLGRD